MLIAVTVSAALVVVIGAIWIGVYGLRDASAWARSRGGSDQE